jgi:hypothetical protein
MPFTIYLILRSARRARLEGRTTDLQGANPLDPIHSQALRMRTKGGHSQFFQTPIPLCVSTRLYDGGGQKVTPSPTENPLTFNPKT